MFSSVKKIIQDAKKGKIFILVDDKNRENEGDLVIPASKIDHKKINFMATHGRGLICLAIDKNKAKALKILRSKLYDLQRSEQESERAKARKSQIGTGDRSERIRTYNFPQGRVTDHRINMTLYKLTDFLAGDAFKELSDAIQIQFQEEQLENLKI